MNRQAPECQDSKKAHQFIINTISSFSVRLFMVIGNIINATETNTAHKTHASIINSVVHMFISPEAFWARLVSHLQSTKLPQIQSVLPCHLMFFIVPPLLAVDNISPFRRQDQCWTPLLVEACRLVYRCAGSPFSH